MPVTGPGDGVRAAAVVRAYQTFARCEARGRSAAYESLAEAVASDAAVVEFIASLPTARQQPQLLFAAARYLLGTPPVIGQLRALIGRSAADLRQVMMARRTQTNEPGRCAILLPALAQLPQPIALIEAGASAGLTLLFDRYSYDYAGHFLAGRDPGAPTLRCEPRGPVPLPSRLPEITWRAGLDLNPLDVTSEDDVRWLSCLVWPGESDRARRLAAAIAAARRDPPTVHRGDLRTDLPWLASQAPPGAHLVIYHSSVLYQVPARQREEFAAAVRGLNASWLSSEAPGMVPGALQEVPPGALPGAPPGVPLGVRLGVRPGVPRETGRASRDELECVLTRDGKAIGFADSHGTWVRWLA